MEFVWSSERIKNHLGRSHRVTEQDYVLWHEATEQVWRWERPWLTNFQLVLNVDHATEVADVFHAKAELQKIIDASNTTVRGCKLEVRIEVGLERKKLLTSYFNHVRAIEEATGLSSEKKGGDNSIWN